MAEVYSLVYVSRSLLDEQAAEEELAAIIGVSTTKNAAAEVTGALLYTGTRFAQLLEGRKADVQSIMASIMRDSRHADITIIYEGSISQRRFASWSMAYSGGATFASRAVERALSDRNKPSGLAAGNLIRLMQELVRSETRPGE